MKDQWLRVNILLCTLHGGSKLTKGKTGHYLKISSSD